MSSHSNRRIRAQRKRHSRTVARLRDRIRTFEGQGRKKEAKAANAELFALLLQSVSVVQVRARTRQVTLKDGTTKDVEVAPFKALRRQPWVEPKIGAPLGLTPTSPVLEKQEPQVHGVNAQRETRSRPKVGGARRKNGS